mmetsp:Transcript_17347/g.37454  ORF Transcript_17347/g.37454 Transcript_17347/m.37454 type:complete len:213 (+) Transcript_17347:1023-1661(+)
MFTTRISAGSLDDITWTEVESFHSLILVICATKDTHIDSFADKNTNARRDDDLLGLVRFGFGSGFGFGFGFYTKRTILSARFVKRNISYFCARTYATVDAIELIFLSNDTVSTMADVDVLFLTSRSVSGFENIIHCASWILCVFKVILIPDAALVSIAQPIPIITLIKCISKRTLKCVSKRTLTIKFKVFAYTFVDFPEIIPSILNTFLARY